MLHKLKHLRDFLDEKQLNWLPTNLKVESCILLVQDTEDKDKIHRRVVQVFDKGGTWIGEISHPDYIPPK